MSTLSKKKKAEEDGSFNDLLSGMPDLTPPPKQSGAKGASREGAVPLGSSSPGPHEMREMLERAREGLEHLLRVELQRVEEGFNEAITLMEGRLHAANEQLERMEKEHAALEEENERHQRRLETLRSLTQQA